jgi:hypothetical protein
MKEAHIDTDTKGNSGNRGETRGGSVEVWGCGYSRVVFCSGQIVVIVALGGVVSLTVTDEASSQLEGWLDSFCQASALQLHV